MGHRYWVAQFVFGGPILGHLCQNRLFKTKSTDLEVPANVADARSLFRTAPNRLLQLSKPTKISRAKAVRNDDLAQLEHGRLGPPEKLLTRSFFSDKSSGSVNFCFRSPLCQHGKVRSVADFKQAGLIDFAFSILLFPPRPGITSRKCLAIYGLARVNAILARTTMLTPTGIPLIDLSILLSITLCYLTLSIRVGMRGGRRPFLLGQRLPPCIIILSSCYFRPLRCSFYRVL